MKRIIILIIFLINVLHGFASIKTGDKKQQKKDRELVEKSEFIFEGKHVASDIFRNPVNNEFWVSDYIKITKIFKGKGKIVPGIIEMVYKSQGGACREERCYGRSEDKDVIIFFNEASTVELPENDTVKKENLIKLKPVGSIRMPGENPTKWDKEHFYDLTFKTNEEVYNFIKKIEGVDKDALKEAKTKKSAQVAPPDTTREERIAKQRKQEAFLDSVIREKKKHNLGKKK